MSKIILDLCGGTGAWSKPYKDAGYNVMNITLPKYDVLKTEFRPQYGDMIFNGSQQSLVVGGNDIYGILAAPPCTQFSFARSRNANLKNPRDLRLGMELVITCLNIIWNCQYKIEKESAKKTTLKFWALENPNGFLKYFLGKPVFVFDPWEFGDMYKKRTALWGWFNNPKKTWFIKPDVPKFGYNKSIKSTPESRSITPSGFAKAFFEANP